MEQNNVDIIIGGYTLEELKKIQTAVRKDASKVISEAIAEAEKAMDELLGLGSEDDLDENDEGYAEAKVALDESKAKIQGLAKLAYEKLSLADTVSGISGVEYYLPYSSDWSSDGYYYKLECAGVDDYEELGRNGAVSSLLGTLEDMEYQSCQWHQSTC